MHKYLTLILTVTCLKVIDAQFKSCTDYDGKRGRCVPIIACHFLLHLESSPNRTYADSLVLEKSYCAPPSGGLTFVCCEETGSPGGSTTTARPTRWTTKRGSRRPRPSRANRRVKTTKTSGSRFTTPNDIFTQTKNYGKTSTRRYNLSTTMPSRDRTTTRRNYYSTENPSRDRTTTRRYAVTTQKPTKGRVTNYKESTEVILNQFYSYYNNRTIERSSLVSTSTKRSTTRRQNISKLYDKSSESDEQEVVFRDRTYG